MADKKADFESLEDYKEFLSSLDDIAEFRDKKGDSYSETAKRINTFSYPSKKTSVITSEKGVPFTISGNELLKHKEYKDEYFSNNPSHEIIKSDGTKDREFSYRLNRESGAAEGATFLEALVAEFEVLANKEAEGKISEKEQGLLDSYRVFLTERTGYAEGGVAIDEQMDAVFKSSRTDIDPVSGNEVPPGSLPEEVRDDIPAMLSEGEYVVPADVLRFYGVKFFEDLRSQAKMGLAEMESNGRIGGEPIEEGTGEVGISDEDLMAIMAQAPQDEPQQVAANRGGLMGFQQGGLSFPEYIKQPDISQFGIAGPDFQGGLEYRKFVNDAGMTMTIPFFNGEPMGMIPPGYTEGDAPTATEEAAPQVSDDDPNEGLSQRVKDDFEAGQREAIDYSNPESVTKAVDEYYAGSAAPALASIVPSGGAVVAGVRFFEKKNLIKGIDEQLNNTELDSDTAKSLSQLKQELKDKDAYRERVGTKGFGDFLSGLFSSDSKNSRPDYSSKLTSLAGPQKDLEWIGSERDAYNAAVESGNDRVVSHFESIDRLRNKQNTFSDKGLSREEGAAMGLSESDMDQAEKYGGSVQRAVDKGEVEKSGGFFSSYEKVDDKKEDEE